MDIAIRVQTILPRFLDPSAAVFISGERWSKSDQSLLRKETILQRGNHDAFLVEVSNLVERNVFSRTEHPSTALYRSDRRQCKVVHVTRIILSLGQLTNQTHSATLT